MAERVIKKLRGVKVPLQILLAGFVLLLLILRSLPPYSYSKDIQVTYITALALRDRIDIFTPIVDLSSRYLPVSASLSPIGNHLPPLLSLFMLPLALLPYSAFILIWLAVNFVLLFWIGRKLGLSQTGSLALAAWPPAFWVLDNGNYELVILALMIAGWRAGRSSREWIAGASIGLAAAIKYYPVLFLAPYVLRRRFTIVTVACGVFALAQLGNLLILSPSKMLFYYKTVLPQASSLWLRLGINCSPHGSLLRLFGGAEDIEPVVEAPWIVIPATLLVSLFGLFALLKLEPENAPLATITALPNVRGYVGILALPAIVDTLRSRRRSVLPFIACAAASYVLPVANLTLLGIRNLLTGQSQQFTWLPSILTSLQAAGCIVLLVLAIAQSGVRRMPKPRKRDLQID
jgi:hypothetical protein